MGDNSASLLAQLAGRMQFLAARTSVIANNIANSDTPDFTPTDLVAPKMHASMAMKTSRAGHISNAATASEAQQKSAPDTRASINGNSVSLESQMMKLSQTRMDYQLASTTYRKGVEMLRMAIRGGR